MLGWIKHKLESRLPGEISITSYAYDITQTLETEEELKSLSMRVKEDSEKANLNQHSKNQGHGIWSNHVMANRGGNNGNSDRLYFCGLQNHSRC